MEPPLMPTEQECHVLAIIPFGFLFLYVLNGMGDAPFSPQPEPAMIGKEGTFLRYNQDGVYGNLLAAEEHLRKVNGKGSDGFLSCVVKHLSLAGNHSSEAVSHTIAISDVAQSQKYRALAEKIVDLQHDVQDGKVSPTESIKQVREIKHDFESFNPSYDVSHCKACAIG